MARQLTLLTGATTTVPGAAQDYDFPGSLAQMVGTGTWDSATVKLQSSFDSGGTWTDTGITISSTSPMVQVRASYGEKLRGAVVGPGASTDLDVSIYHLPE